MLARTIVVCTLLVYLTYCAQIPLSSLPQATRTPVSPERAAQYALEALHADSGTGRLIGTPTLMRGQVMPLGDAYALVNGKPLTERSTLALRRDRLVWLVVTRGTWLLHIPGGHGDPRNGTPMVMPKDVTVDDLWNAILFDAVTEQVYDQGGIVESQRALLGGMPELR